MTAPRLDGDCLAEREAFEIDLASEFPLQRNVLLHRRAITGAPENYAVDWVQARWEGWNRRGALSASKQAGWQPISTAPKDGTHILVSWPMRLMDDEGAPIGEITRRDTLVTWMNGNSWIEPDYLGASGEWYGDDDCYAADPDFWMPLPPAPAAQPQGDKT